MERLSELGYSELLYGDASHINEQPNVPYGWQFDDEKVFMPSDKGVGINLFGFISRANRLIYEMTNERMTGDFVIGQIEKLLDTLEKPTVIVLDNASAHRNKRVRERIPYWAERGLYIFYLPVYSPNLSRQSKKTENIWKNCVRHLKLSKPPDLLFHIPVSEK